MVLAELKSVIAENCPEYEPNHVHTLINMSALAGNCRNCSNFVRGRCIKNLIDELSEIISRN